MIQRKQTAFLLLAVALSVACLCMPLCTFVPRGEVGVASTMYNLWVSGPGSGHDLSVWALFAILLVTCPVALFTIFAFHNRRAQARLCVFNALLLAGWYAVFAIMVLGRTGDAAVHVRAAAAFPLIALALHLVARRAILADEALVRAADRIR